MPERLPDVVTPIAAEDALRVLASAWVEVFTDRPTKPALVVLLAHHTHECGRGGHSMHCWNWGNFKSVEGDGRDWTFFTCDEVLPVEKARALEAADPARVRIEYVTGADAAVAFKPDHPICRFRAYEDAVHGAGDYLLSLRHRFASAWPSVVAGDPVGFSRALKSQGYYTAPEPGYTRALSSLFAEFSRLPFDDSQIPVLDSAAREALLGLVALTSTEMLQDGFEVDREADTDPDLKGA